MSAWLELDQEKMRRALQNIYMLASLKRTVVHRYENGKSIPIGPKSDDSDWDHIIRFCESAGLRHSIVRAV